MLVSQAAAQSGFELLAVHEMRIAVAVPKFSTVRYIVSLHSKYTGHCLTYDNLFQRLVCSAPELEALRRRAGENVTLQYYASLDLPPALAIQRFLACA